jgi:class 3 adenylate cyclase
VILGNIGGGEVMRYTVTGNVVNLTHRLVEKAEGGQIVISDEVFDCIGVLSSQFTVVHSANVALKGIDELQLVHCLVNRTHTKD